MRKRKHSIYKGSNSINRLPVYGKVNTGNEILLNAVASAFDSVNRKMLTRGLGVFNKDISVKEINNRFNVLKTLCRKYAPNKLGVVNQVHKIAVDNLNNKISDNIAINNLNNITKGLNDNNLNIAALHVNQAENFMDPFGVDMFLFMNNKKGCKKW